MIRHNAYGVIGQAASPGKDTFQKFMPDAVFTGNVIAGGDQARYPSGNRFPSSAEFQAQFVAFAGGNYHLTAASRWRRAGTDGRDLGAAFEEAGSF